MAQPHVKAMLDSFGPVDPEAYDRLVAARYVAPAPDAPTIPPDADR